VEGRHNILLALERTLKPGIARPAEPEISRRASNFNISVLFTSVAATISALKRAGELAHGLGVRLTLLVPQIVPYPVPLDSPPVLLDWNEHRFAVIAQHSAVETSVRIYLCRNRMQTLDAVLSPGSILVVGTRQRWWPTAETRLARQLRRAGHEVILAPTE
jgi:hypothetical protein